MRAGIRAVVVVVWCVACGGEPTATIVCPALECTEAQWTDVYDRAAADLEAEGVAVTPESLNDPVIHDRFMERVGSLVGTTPATMAAAKYNDSVSECGLSGSDVTEIHGGPCVNPGCYAHDRCYDEIVGYTTACAWSARTDVCDRRLLDKMRSCGGVIGCGTDLTCVSSVVGANWLYHFCDLPFLHGPVRRAFCQTQAALCSGCLSVDIADVCETRGSTCGELADSCGATRSCGTCAAGVPCQGDDEREEDRAFTCAACVSGVSESEACGNCGSRMRACVDGSWGAWSACTGQATCSPGSSEPCGAGGQHTCTTSCTWGSCNGQTCAGPAQQSCGWCGTQSRTCDAGNGQWSPWGSCGGEGECNPGVVEACGVGGQRTCSTGCAWSACIGGGGGCGDGTCGAAEDPTTCAVDCAPIAMAPERLGRVTQGGCATTTMGWHATNGSPYWTYATTCALPSIFSPTTFNTEYMRWRWQIRKAGLYRVSVRIPSSTQACGFSITNFTTAAQYYLVRPAASPVGDLRTVNQQASAGIDAIISSGLNTNVGELALYLYDSVTDIPTCCECSTSKRVFHDSASVDWVGP